MGFRNDFSQATQNNGLKPEGDYEVLIVKAEERQTKNGKLGLNISMVIRNDVEQGYKNDFIFHTLWNRREPTRADMQVNGYGFGQVMALGKAAQLPDGKDYPDLQAFLQDLLGKPVRVHLVHDTYNNTERESVSYIDPTKYPEVRHVKKQQVSANTYANQTYANQAPQNRYAAQAQQAAGTTPSGYASDPLLDEDIPF